MYRSASGQGNSSRGSSHGSRQGGRRGGFAHSRPSSFQGRRPAARPSFNNQRSRGSNIHHSKFIKKAEPMSESAPFVPVHTFADFAIDERLKKNITKKGYVTPTPIQDAAIHVALTGRDVVGLAETGTGKTAGFLIPLLDKVLKNPGENVLIMAPTRELAVQIEDEFRTFTSGLPLRSALAVGGANINTQIRNLRSGVQFLIGTPGRIMDLMDRGEIRLAKCKNVVLDEADRMLDMGFIDSVRGILSEMSPERHTLFFSATLSREIEALIGEFLNNPERISVRKQETSQNVDQDVVRVAPGKTKFDQLDELLRSSELTKVLVFGRTKHGVEKLSKMLQQRGHDTESIHGNKSHSQRLRALQLFRDERIRVLVATDVAARGLDIPRVSHVINFDVPNTYEDYVHRIGRTGRAGQPGKALTFVD